MFHHCWHPVFPSGLSRECVCIWTGETEEGMCFVPSSFLHVCHPVLVVWCVCVCVPCEEGAREKQRIHVWLCVSCNTHTNSWAVCWFVFWASSRQSVSIVLKKTIKPCNLIQFFPFYCRLLCPVHLFAFTSLRFSAASKYNLHQSVTLFIVF